MQPLLNLHRRIKCEFFFLSLLLLACAVPDLSDIVLFSQEWCGDKMSAHIQLKRNFRIILLQKVAYYLSRVALCLKIGNNSHSRAGKLLQLQLNHSQLKNKQSNKNNTTLFCKYSLGTLHQQNQT